ncbi:FxSxx-COOH system tetratricopeptide repeat protein [Dactylosporangium sp. NPDC050688]|uniref:FxSxx-COOH system tetratricopeptide repeat protein n=1 Tax=Dactylosporangium sp. NPDC050688 TaxID=3157217 RepID=UPI0033F87302
MTQDRDGQVVTFYSYKGGTGRTMALANVAWILAANGKRVLVADWDLESPGLHRFFAPFVNPRTLEATTGVIDMVRQFEWATTRQGPGSIGDYEQYARVARHAFSLDWQFPHGGSLDMLMSGRQNSDYATSLSGLDWDAFYEHLGGGEFFDALRADMKRNYDYALIDSRSGLSDVADICTLHLPDLLVDCFTLTDQGIDGAARVARAVATRQRAIRILPVPMRVDLAEKERAEAGLALARKRFSGFPQELDERDRERYWLQVEVPYRPFYAYEEMLAVFGDRPGGRQTLLAAYEALTARITDGAVSTLPAIDESFRGRVLARFSRQLTNADQEVVLHYADADQLWAEWLERLLVTVGVRVIDAHTSPDAAAQGSGRDLVLISPANTGEARSWLPDGRSPRAPVAVYVEDVRPVPDFPIDASVFLSDVSEQHAADRLLRVLGWSDAAPEPGSIGIRFPGRAPQIFNVPARNARFTGRADELRKLRETLRGQGGVAALIGNLPTALNGMGGVGKTQIAIEYAHRFRNAYDVVWWISAESVVFVDSALADLGRRMGVLDGPTETGTVASVLAALANGTPFTRWLLIFDNAEDPQSIAEFLPSGPGHVLITSRNPGWHDRAKALPVDVFARSESVEHLRRRVESIDPQDASRIAEWLGDLPIAVAAAGAWLADTGTPVSEYLRMVETPRPHALMPSAFETTWSLSLQRLQERSPGAYRLLQLCSVMAPEIALDLVYSDELARAIIGIDPQVSDRMYRGSLVQQINRLALLKLDATSGTIQVHRLLQYAVRDLMSESDLDDSRHQIHRVLAALRPAKEVEDPESWPRFRMLWPHVEATDALQCPDDAVRQLMIDRVRYLLIRGALQQARETAERVSAIWTSTLDEGGDTGPLRRHLLHLRHVLGSVLRDLAQVRDAYDIDRAVLAEQQALLGDDHPHTLMTAGGLAADLRAIGRYQEALHLDLRTYDRWTEILGNDHPRSLAALTGIAASSRLTGDYRHARDCDELAYERSGVVLGANHLTTLAAGAGLGRDLLDTGEFEAAVALLTAIVERFQSVLEPHGRATLNARASLAAALRTAGRPKQGSHAAEAYSGLMDAFGPRSLDTVAARMTYGLSLLASDDLDGALEHLRSVHDAYRAGLGPHHPYALLAGNNVGVALRTGGSPGAAGSLAATTAEQVVDTLGRRHPYSLRAWQNHAVVLAEIGEEDRAAEILDGVARDLTDVLGSGHPDTVRVEANLAIVRRNTTEDVVLRLRRAFGASHPVVRAVEQGLLTQVVIDVHPL